MSDSELIWWRQSTNLSSFVRDSHAGCVLYNGKDNRWQMDWYISISYNLNIFKLCEMLGSLATTSLLGWLTNARLVRKFHPKGCFSSFNHYQCLNTTTDKNFLGNHKCTASHFIILSIRCHVTYCDLMTHVCVRDWINLTNPTMHLSYIPQFPKFVPPPPPPRIQSMIIQLWFRKLLGAEQTTSQFVNQWQCCLLTHICDTRPGWKCYLSVSPLHDNLSIFQQNFIH